MIQYAFGVSLDFWSLESGHPEILQSINLACLNILCIFSTQFLSRTLIFNAEFQNSIIPGIFQELCRTLEFPWKFPIFWQFQGIGYFSHSVFVKELDFQYEIPIFHHSWNLPGITWNSGMPLELAIFLPNLAYSCGILLTYGYLTLFQLGWAVFGPSNQKLAGMYTVLWLESPKFMTLLILVSVWSY